MSEYEGKLVEAVSRLSTDVWGTFFFAMPCIVTPAAVLPAMVMNANTVRVLIPDVSIDLAEPRFGKTAWDIHGTIGLKDYPGVLIPLSIIKELNPAFDYIKILCHGMRRHEYEAMAVEHLAFLQQTLNKL
jgi:hypothetical protein